MDWSNFGVGVHLVFIPMTVAVGFLLGWLARGSVERMQRARRPRR